MNPDDPRKSAGSVWHHLKRVAPYLYRHEETKEYYARKRFGQKVVLHCFETTDGRVAKAKLADWLDEKEKVDPVTSLNTLEALIDHFQNTRAYCEESTKVAERTFLKYFRSFFDCTRRVNTIRPSELCAFVNKTSEKRDYSAATYNRLCLFVRQLFEAARLDGMTSQNLFLLSGIRKRRVHRVPPSIPTQEQFEAILAKVRELTKNEKRNLLR